MPEYEYTADQALEALLKRLEDASPALLERVLLALKAGTEDVREEEIESRGRAKTPKTHQYRKTRAFTDEEALAAALDVLRAHLIEAPECIHSATHEFQQCKLGPPVDDEIVRYGVEELHDANDIALFVEVEPETARPTGQRKTIPLKPPSRSGLDELKQLFEALGDLTDFGGTSDGDTG